MAVRHKLGTLSPLIYFENHTDPAHPPGFILVAPYTDCPTPEGYSREGAGTLAEVDRINDRLRAQIFAQFDGEAQYNESMCAAVRQAVADRLYARMTSGSTSQWERDFIREYLKLREEKRERNRRSFECREAYLRILADDTPRGRDDDQETVNLDRIG